MVRGIYECDESGGYRLGPAGEFLLQRVRCDHDEGRCAQTLCVLHRYNCRGPGAWFPSKIQPMTEPHPAVPAREKPNAAASRTDDGDINLLR